MLHACGSYCSKIRPFKLPFMPVLRYVTFGTFIHLENQDCWKDEMDSIKDKTYRSPEGLTVHAPSSALLHPEIYTLV